MAAHKLHTSAVPHFYAVFLCFYKCFETFPQYAWFVLVTFLQAKCLEKMKFMFAYDAV